MKDLFKGYYRPSEEDFHELWRQCVFIFDANVLLGLYRYPKNTREDFFNVLNHINSRIWVPHQVALEFQKNRLDVIADQFRKFSEVEKIIGRVKTDLSKNLNALQLERRHSTINPDEFLGNFDKAIRVFQESLEELKKNQPNISDQDTIRERLDSILYGKVGPQLSDQDLKDLYSEGKNRYQNRTPPGYSDQKTGMYTFKGQNLQREYGDLILWQQIINHAKDQNSSHIIFITDDEKEDWWWVHDGDTIGPRPELVEEIADKAKVKIFYMYQ